MARTRFRFVSYEIRPDDTAEHEFEARCVYGDEAECGAESGLHPDPAEVDEWQRHHTQETRNTRYRRSRSDYQIWKPTEPVPPPIEPGQAAEVVPS